MATQEVALLTVTELLSDHQVYAQARRQFLAQLNLPISCRDPLAEMSEILIAKLLGATTASSRVQKGYDLISIDKRHIQVKYLANGTAKWVNEHTIRFTDNVDDYALVIFVALQIESVLIFPRETLTSVCQRLKKRHPLQELQLQFTRQNYASIVQSPDTFQDFGVKLFQFEADNQAES